MVVRENGKTKQKFYGCIDFPNCRGTRAMNEPPDYDGYYGDPDEDDWGHPGHPSNYGDN